MTNIETITLAQCSPAKVPARELFRAYGFCTIMLTLFNLKWLLNGRHVITQCTIGLCLSRCEPNTLTTPSTAVIAHYYHNAQLSKLAERSSRGAFKGFVNSCQCNFEVVVLKLYFKLAVFVILWTKTVLFSNLVPKD